ncbi:receptor-type tyrosine-protein phosphatase S-like [Penaeus chinensis]|uniref:receptor-type tyrosine-protein phosphatase S-like n=1 Tax=Penaeus chinensis TaxID=139456 RepID=UPI001FB7A94B|nr:receptor-type tyrosine-protein phosphatase S-like [Penaeus chinensis]
MTMLVLLYIVLAIVLIIFFSFLCCRPRLIKILSYFLETFIRIKGCLRSCCERTEDGQVKFLKSLRNLYHRVPVSDEMIIVHLSGKVGGAVGEEVLLTNGTRAKRLPLASPSEVNSETNKEIKKEEEEDKETNKEKEKKEENKEEKEEKEKDPEEAGGLRQVPSNRVRREDLEAYLNHVVRRGDLEAEFRGCHDPRAYIATQGPKDYKDNTIEDFWRMVWEQHCNTVVMVARLIEGGKVKVAQYWPDVKKAQVTYGDFSLSIVGEEKELDYFIRRFTLTHAGESREVTQYQFIAWPDHGVPQAPFTFSLMTLEIRRTEITGPLLVHCSAGIGRTGTLLLVLVLLDQLDSEGYIDAPASVALLRQGRPMLVENQMQYRFAHQLLLEILYSDVTNYPVSDFVNLLPDLDEEIKVQYKKLKGTERNLSFKWASKPAHARLNRNLDLLPVDGRQVLLQMVNGQAETQYINAVRLNGVTQHDAMVVMEHPLPETLPQAWRMIYEKKVSAWVLLNAYGEDELEDFPPVISEGEMDLGFITLTLDGSQSKDFCLESRVTLAPVRSRYAVAHSVQVLQLAGWRRGSELPDGAGNLLALLADVHEIRRKAPTSPVVFSCGDGCTASGLAAALDVILMRIDLLRDVDVYRAVQALLYERPQFITSFEQYKFLFTATAEKIKMNPKEKEEEEEETLIKV